jgi:CRP-like cAMP-binding protein
VSDIDPPMAILVRKLASRGALAAEDEAAILALPYVTRTYETRSYLMREGEPAKRFCSVVLSGFACGHLITVRGPRQVVSLHMSGDILNLQNLFLKQADRNVQALTRLDTAEIEREALKALAAERPAVAQALWVDTLVDASVGRSWMVNIGRRDARTRVAHLLCEFATRMKAAGLDEGGGYEIPMTQEQIGDATGLTSVHVNRTLRSLAQNGLVHRGKRYLALTDLGKLSSDAEFNPLYLQPDLSEPAP